MVIITLRCWLSISGASLVHIRVHFHHWWQCCVLELQKTTHCCFFNDRSWVSCSYSCHQGGTLAACSLLSSCIPSCSLSPYTSTTSLQFLSQGMIHTILVLGCTEVSPFLCGSEWPLHVLYLWCFWKGYNAELRLIDQLYETAHMIEEASYYNIGMWQVDSTATTDNMPWLAPGKPMTWIGPNWSVTITKGSIFQHPLGYWGPKGASNCYKFILIFKSKDCQNIFYWSWCLYAALD